MIYLVMVVIGLSLTEASKAQDVSSTSAGINNVADYNDQSGKYDLTLKGLTEKQAIGLLVDYSIRAKVPDVQRVYVFEVKYLEDKKLYEVSTTEVLENSASTWPAYYTNVGDVRKFLKEEIQLCLAVLD